MICNLIYVHLSRDRGHAEQCTGALCVASCPTAGFHAWLDGPLTVADQRAHDRKQDRERQLLRGEVPA